MSRKICNLLRSLFCTVWLTPNSLRKENLEPAKYVLRKELKCFLYFIEYTFLMLDICKDNIWNNLLTDLKCAQDEQTSLKAPFHEFNSSFSGQPNGTITGTTMFPLTITYILYHVQDVLANKPDCIDFEQLSVCCRRKLSGESH